MEHFKTLTPPHREWKSAPFFWLLYGIEHQLLPPPQRLRHVALPHGSERWELRDLELPGPAFTSATNRYFSAVASYTSKPARMTGETPRSRLWLGLCEQAALWLVKRDMFHFLFTSTLRNVVTFWYADILFLIFLWTFASFWFTSLAIFFIILTF